MRKRKYVVLVLIMMLIVSLGTSVIAEADVVDSASSSWTLDGHNESSKIPMYSPNGEVRYVSKIDANKLKRNGWSRNPNDDTTIVYDSDGETQVIFSSDLQTYIDKDWAYIPSATVYAPDGRRQTIPDSDVQSWVNVGWYTRPVTMVYASDGSSSVIFSSDIQDAINNGWYTQPVTTVYAPDGTQSVIYSSDVDNAKSQGWYTYPVTTVYAPDGRSEIIPVSDLNAWLNVGWYKDKATAQKYFNINIIINEPGLSRSVISKARAELGVPANIMVDATIVNKLYKGYTLAITPGSLLKSIERNFDILENGSITGGLFQHDNREVVYEEAYYPYITFYKHGTNIVLASDYIKTK